MGLMNKLTARNNKFLALVKQQSNARLYAIILDVVNDPNNGTTREATIIAVAYLLQFVIVPAAPAHAAMYAEALAIDSIEAQDIANKALATLAAVDRTVMAPTVLVLRRAARQLTEGK